MELTGSIHQVSLMSNDLVFEAVLLPFLYKSVEQPIWFSNFCLSPVYLLKNFPLSFQLL